MVKINDLMSNFRNYLRQACRSLDFLGHDIGSDAWDELSELGFEILVNDELKSRFKYRLEHVYAEGGESLRDKRIDCVVRPGTRVTFGQHDLSEAVPLTRWSKWDPAREPILFEFRAFYSPDFTVPGLGSLDFVYGLIRDEAATESVVRRVCVPFDGCDFYCPNR